MKQISRKIAVAVISLIVLATLTLYAVSEWRLTRTYSVQPISLEIPTDAAAIAEGKRIATVRGCRDCHGDNLAGKTVLEDGAIGNIYASNLTRGVGGVGNDYGSHDFVRAIRHGLKTSGQPIRFMPAMEYYTINDSDVAALVAYIHSVPAVDNDPGKTSIGPLGRALWLAGQMDIVAAAEVIPHEAPRPETAVVGSTVEYGSYLAQGCIACHTPSFKGGPMPGAAADVPIAADLTTTGSVGEWTLAEFTAVLRTGVRPDGSELNPAMPWPATQAMTDTELEALYLFFRSLE
ncbi:MAG: c-type cytochrome [Chloroflexota bacterium]